MGSYCSIHFDDVEVCSAKSRVPDEFCAIFQESDRQVRERYSGDQRSQEVVYRATREVILDRLTLLGCTEAVTRQRFTEWIAEQREIWGNHRLRKYYGETTIHTVLQDLTIEQWYERVPRSIVRREDREDSSDEIARHMDLYTEGSWLWFAGYGSLISFRALLEACPNVSAVTLDVTDLVEGG